MPLVLEECGPDLSLLLLTNQRIAREEETRCLTPQVKWSCTRVRDIRLVMKMLYSELQDHKKREKIEIQEVQKLLDKEQVLNPLLFPQYLLRSSSFDPRLREVPHKSVPSRHATR